MQEYRTQSWPDVVDAFHALAAANPSFEPLHTCVARLAASPLAAGLYPIKSMHTLRLYQHERVTAIDEEVRVDLEGGELVVRHLPGGPSKSDPRFALVLPPGVWTKRGPDGIALLERAFHHLGWFVEYGT